MLIDKFETRLDSGMNSITSVPMIKTTQFSLLNSSIRMNELQHLTGILQHNFNFLVQFIYDSLYVTRGDKNFLLSVSKIKFRLHNKRQFQFSIE